MHPIGRLFWDKISGAFPQVSRQKSRNVRSSCCRRERTWAISIQTVSREPKYRIEFPYVSREEQPEFRSFRRERDFYEPLLTAMAQVLPFLFVIKLQGKE